jgi:DNA-binding transcriptional LysR family regulator
LTDESFVAVSRASAPAFADLVRDLCQSANFRPRIILESPRAQAVALMVAVGSGIALLPATLAELVKRSTHAIPLRPAAKITHVFACKDRKTEGPIADLIRLLR